MQGRVAGREDGEEDGGSGGLWCEGGSGRARKGTDRRIESKDGVGGPCWGRERGWEVRMVWVAG